MSAAAAQELSIDGTSFVKPWDFENVNDENNPNDRAQSIAQKTLADLKKQLDESSAALKKSKNIINVLRKDKKSLKNQVGELTASHSQLEAKLEATKADAMAISNSLNQVQVVVNKSKNDKVRCIERERGGREACFCFCFYLLSPCCSI